MVKTSLKIFCLFLISLFIASCQLLQATVIVVEFGKYKSAEEAALAEANVNWTDSNLADDIICTSSFAAIELQRYLRLITGSTKDFMIIKPQELENYKHQKAIILITIEDLKKTLPRSELIKPSEIEKLGEEGYIIRNFFESGRTGILITALTRIGLLYGAYDFLYRLGLRWYAPGETHEIIPRLSPETVLRPIEAIEYPLFQSRGFHAWENRASRDFLLWMARNRLNYWCVDQEDKPFLHKLGIKLSGGGHVLTSYYLGPDLEYPYNHPLFQGDESKPADPYSLSSEFLGDANHNGILSYYEAHPEWYGLIDGKRSSRIEGDFGDNFCTSNQEALAEWIKNAIKDLASGRYKDATFLNVWTLDVGNWCQCDKCRALGSPTDRNLLLVHALAKAIKKAQADRIITRPIRLLFLSYADVIEPPSRPLPSDFDYDMCIATFFPIVRCYVHNFNDPDCSVNSNYLKLFRGWFLDPNRYYRGQVWIGEYYNVSGYKSLPVCYMHTMANDIPFYYSVGARHFHYMHVTTENWGPKALTNWQLSRQLWNPSLNCEDLWSDYFQNRYGPAHKIMRDFYENLERMLCNISELKYSLGRRMGRGEKELFPNPHLRYQKIVYDKDDGPDWVEILEATRKCRQSLNHALNLNLPPKIMRIIKEDERNFCYAERTILFYDALVRAILAQAEGKIDQARAAFWQARDLSILLKSDTTSTKYSSSHANADNALEASYAGPALLRLAKELSIGNKETIETTPFYQDKFNLLVFKDEKGQEIKINSPQEWERRRYHILANFQKVAGLLPSESKLCPLDIKILSNEDLGDVIRKKIIFQSEPASYVFAYLLLPKKLERKAPAILCLHQTTKVGKGEPSDIPSPSKLPYALELARLGFVTLAPDYPGYGDDQSDPYALGYESATMKGIWNHIRAVDVLVSLPEVDPERIGVLGHSLGGHNSIFVALFDPRLKAIVTSCGFNSFKKYKGGDLTGWSHRGYMPSIAQTYQKDPDRMPFDFSELLPALAPRPVFISAPANDDNFEVSGVKDCLKAAQPVYELLGAREGLKAMHPNLGHGFPPEIRQQAYDFLINFLKN